MYIHQAVNVNYYKYMVDGMNVILVNMLAVVVTAIVMGFADPHHSVFSQEIVRYH